MDRWSGRVAVVTGSAAGGIGTAIALALSGAKLRVVGLDLNDPQFSNCPENIMWRRCDVSNLDELKSTFQWIEDTCGGVDIMVNCAGHFKIGHITSVGSNPVLDEDISRVMDVNIMAVIFGSRLAVDSMRRRGVDGHIVNICSLAGHYIPLAEVMNVYACSKYAVRALSESLSHEFAVFGNKIKVTNISPGTVKTPLIAKFVGDAPHLLPKDVADAVVYAISTPPNVNVREL